MKTYGGHYTWCHVTEDNPEEPCDCDLVPQDCSNCGRTSEDRPDDSFLYDLCDTCREGVPAGSGEAPYRAYGITVNLL